MTYNLFKFSDQINSLLFVENDLLFSASYDTHIKLWRICGPNDEKITQMLKDIETKDNLLSLFYSEKYHLLMASGMKGLFFWWKPLDLNESSDTVLAQMKTKTLVDGLHGLPKEKDLIAIRIHLTKCISIIDLKKVSELLAEEMEKNENKSEIKTILFSKVLKAKLKSFDFEYPFIYLSAEKNLLVSGGPNGQIWVYNTNGFAQNFGSNQMISADRILEWPIVENITKDQKKVFDDKKPVIVNTVAVSPDLKYMIACTSMNLICIWRKT